MFFPEPTRARCPLLAYYKASSIGLQQKVNTTWATLMEKEREIISELFQKNSESQEVIVENFQNISEKIVNFSETL